MVDIPTNRNPLEFNKYDMYVPTAGGVRFAIVDSCTPAHPTRIFSEQLHMRERSIERANERAMSLGPRPADTKDLVSTQKPAKLARNPAKSTEKFRKPRKWP